MTEDKPPFGPIDPQDLPLVKAPDSLWRAIEAGLAAEAHPRKSAFRWWPFALAASAAAAVALVVYVAAPRQPKPAWEVVRLDGSPSVGSKPIGEQGKLAVGEWLQTDGSSRARINVGEIGIVDVAPDTRVRLVAARPNEHRLSLAHGEISAVVSAPPRLFLVDLPVSTAVDLGCAYTMRTDDSGNGLLQVTSGWVSLEWEGRDSMVPAGARCRTHEKSGPGTPYFADASEALQQALSAFDFEKGSSRALDTILSAARARDTLTLWHLLTRVNAEDRLRVFDRMIELVPLPENVSRDKALALDRETLNQWREELESSW